MSSVPDSVYFVISTQVSSRYVSPSICAAAAGHVPSSVENHKGNKKKKGRICYTLNVSALNDIGHDSDALTLVSREVQ
jgi:hypothetical protein